MQPLFIPIIQRSTCQARQRDPLGPVACVCCHKSTARLHWLPYWPLINSFCFSLLSISTQNLFCLRVTLGRISVQEKCKNLNEHPAEINYFFKDCFIIWHKSYCHTPSCSRDCRMKAPIWRTNLTTFSNTEGDGTLFHHHCGAAMLNPSCFKTTVRREPSQKWQTGNTPVYAQQHCTAIILYRLWDKHSLTTTPSIHLYREINKYNKPSPSHTDPKHQQQKELS